MHLILSILLTIPLVSSTFAPNIYGVGGQINHHREPNDPNKRAVVFIEGAIKQLNGGRWASEIRQYADLEVDYIDISINSPGGIVVSGLKIVEAIHYAQWSGSEVRCFVKDMAASMAWVIYTQCDKRYARLDSGFMSHYLSLVCGWGCRLFLPDLQEATKKSTRLQLRLNKLIRTTFIVSDELYHHLNKEEIWMSPVKANAFSPGFINGIIDKHTRKIRKDSCELLQKC